MIEFIKTTLNNFTTAILALALIVAAMTVVVLIIALSSWNIYVGAVVFILIISALKAVE